MKYQSLSAPLLASALAGILASTLLNCSSDTKTAAPTSASGAAGQAGDTGGDAGHSPAMVCGKLASLSTCDPVSAAGCDVVGGETCDYDFDTGFVCYPGPNSAGPGEACGKTTAFCAASTTCNGDLHQCEHFCCVDTDCEHGKCEPKVFSDGAASVGVCTGEFAVQSAAGEGGAGGESAAGTSGAGGAGG